MVTCMRRRDLEDRLEELGWVLIKTIHGHRVWRHPTRVIVIAVPDAELILDSVADEILDYAER